MTSPPAKLSGEINTATRSLHTHLNALITSRLPLALPPHAESPDAYLSGLLPFARVYIAFEKIWDEISADIAIPKHKIWTDENWIDVPLDESVNNLNESPADKDGKERGFDAEAAIVLALRSLRPHGLPRSDRLRRDIATLAGIKLEDVDGFMVQHETPATRAFVEHIAEVVAARPQVLLAYAFVLYMAIFSGGRWIRSVLAGAGTHFWSSDVPQASDNQGGSSTESSVNEKLRTFTLSQQETFETLGLSFWFFPSLSDGVDIKSEFKRRLEGSERFLTTQMREDVVDEAKNIFVRCEGLVGELDEAVGRQGKVVTGKPRSVKQASSSGLLQQIKPPAWRRDLNQVLGGNWYDIPGYAGIALVLSCVSWYALYHSGAWA